uniref:Uncharacterized protein n=1 Tax=Candidatus Kentrum sp. SD TaxID=2126332 RepID=A0A451BMV1_9GAMM|nr:MAG: hypothetical protein BECKSD772D_GA0070982_10565 [Candidatus Kentron sp. SD]
MFWKNKNSEKTGAHAGNTPFGAYCYALTNKKGIAEREAFGFIMYVHLQSRAGNK